MNGKTLAYNFVRNAQVQKQADLGSGPDQVGTVGLGQAVAQATAQQTGPQPTALATAAQALAPAVATGQLRGTEITGVLRPGAEHSLFRDPDGDSAGIKVTADRHGTSVMLLETTYTPPFVGREVPRFELAVNGSRVISTYERKVGVSPDPMGTTIHQAKIEKGDTVTVRDALTGEVKSFRVEV